ncbi:MAG: ubiquinol-cytochrome c reductase iron-sulfur subunit [Acidimicrobiales bacterium]
MTDFLSRRKALVRIWQAGAGLIAAAFALTSWDLLQPLPTSGFGGKVRTIKPDAVPETGVVEVPAARSYLTRVNGEVVAISEKCTHLGCRVPFCDTSGQFECPCHGSVFNRAGDFIAGPAPRGMDTYPTEVGDDGLLYIDTGAKTDGGEPGNLQIDEPAKGPSCATEGGH